MSTFKTSPAKGQTVRITQTLGDLKAGIQMKDLSRISAYSGDKGVHTGAKSPTIGRGGQPFRSK